MNDRVRKFKNFIGHLILHSAGLVALLWISGAVVAYVTDPIAHDWKKIGPNMEAFRFFEAWLMWLKTYWSQLGFDTYDYLKAKLILALFGPFLLALVLYIKFWDKIREYEPFPGKEKVYGDAQWATQAEVKRAGLRAKEGMLLGVDSYGYFVSEGFQHALLFAPTGSGKGVGFVIPNLLFWTHSVVVHDIKLENYDLTSGWRAKSGQEVYVWEPANPDGLTHCYNPIDWVSSKPGQMVDDVQKIGNLIMPEKDFWNNEARSLFLGVVLYLIADHRKPKSFGEVVRTMRSDDVVYNLAIVLDTLGKVIHPVAYMNIAAFLQKADKERSGVISTMNSSLELWANPLIDAATASSDFNVLEFKKKRTTVYVGLTPDNINRLQKLMQVFYQQATEFLSRKMPNVKEEPYGVLFLMDEFPTLGKMEQFKAGIAYFRGYRVRLFLIIQDTQQLKGTYEEAGMNSFLSNSTYRITFAANNYETANLISQLCGNKTVQQESFSKPKFFDLNPATRSVNVSQVQRALLLPQEVIQLPRDQQIVLIESFPPIKSQKIKYFADKFFTVRLLPATFVPTQEPFDPSKFGKDLDADDTEASTDEQKLGEDKELESEDNMDTNTGADVDDSAESTHTEDDDLDLEEFDLDDDEEGGAGIAHNEKELAAKVDDTQIDKDSVASEKPHKREEKQDKHINVATNELKDQDKDVQGHTNDKDLNLNNKDAVIEVDEDPEDGEDLEDDENEDSEEDEEDIDVGDNDDENTEDSEDDIGEDEDYEGVDQIVVESEGDGDSPNTATGDNVGTTKITPEKPKDPKN